MLPNFNHHPSSYRDPSGFVFEKDGVLYRQVNSIFKNHFDYFIQSGLYDHLTRKGMLICHTDIDQNLTGSPAYYRTIRPEVIGCVSYPYEWSFDMLKDAALLTLQLVKEALAFDMILKDASPYNIQWQAGNFIFIDTLSFERYDQTPWIAYHQFCEFFLAPLLLMHYTRRQMPELFLAWPDGIPLPIASSLLPRRSKFSLYTYLHIHMQARIAEKKNNFPGKVTSFSRQKLLNLIRNLEFIINKLKSPASTGGWSGYYGEAAQRSDYLGQKKMIINNWIDKMTGVQTVLDLGANNGEFSLLTADKKIDTIAVDMDPYCINEVYKMTKQARLKKLQPMVVDLSHPSPAIGVNNNERKSFTDRIHADLTLALALVHHLAIGKNIPFEIIAKTFRVAGRKLIIEFIPKEDEKIKLMLQHKKDIYADYEEANFVTAFGSYFTIEEKKIIGNSGRTLYLMTANHNLA